MLHLVAVTGSGLLVGVVGGAYTVLPVSSRSHLCCLTGIGDTWNGKEKCCHQMEASSQCNLYFEEINPSLVFGV